MFSMACGMPGGMKIAIPSSSFSGAIPAGPSTRAWPCSTYSTSAPGCRWSAIRLAGATVSCASAAFCACMVASSTSSLTENGGTAGAAPAPCFPFGTGGPCSGASLTLIENCAA